MEKTLLQNLQMSNKKGSAGIDNSVDKVIGLVIVIAIIGGTATQLFNFNLTASGAPTWVQNVLVVFVGIGIVYLVWRLISKK